MKKNSVSPKEILTITTFGQFDVLLHGVSLVKLHASSVKIWELLKFMLTHKDRAFTPETLAEQLWIDEDYGDPRSTLRKQMHRLRQLLHQQESDSDKAIDFSNGYYRWNPVFSYQLDAEIFEKAIKNAEALKSTRPTEALEYFLKATTLYSGDYLPDCLEQHWVFPIRNYYKRLYLGAVIQTIELLIQHKNYDEIISLCEKAIQIDIYEEIFHIQYMEALINKGYHKQAISHYEHITSFFYREMGISPSLALKTFYKKMTQLKATKSTDQDVIASLESEDSFDNAYFCEPDIFKSIYELERRRSARSGAPFSVGFITIGPLKGNNTTQTTLRVNHVKDHLLISLRKGDTVTLWSDFQLLILLPGVNAELMDQIMSRIFLNFSHIETISIKQITNPGPVTSEPYVLTTN
jgi:DNA-binding SARP family transcriptional activator